jgi:hypothetical protein
MTTAVARRPSLKAQILAYLNQYDPQTNKRRGITQLEAIGLWRCYRLSARIKDLRASGTKIRTEIKRDTTGKTFARYFLK